MPGFQAGRHQRPVPRGRRRRGACAAPSTRIRAEVSHAIAERRPHHRAVGPQQRRGATRRSRRCCSRRRVHHHLIREKTRTQVGLVVECGDAREVHHMALLLGYGAGADQPVPGVRVDRGHDRRAASTARRARRRTTRCTNYIKAAGKGVLKVMSKMGISTVASYTGAQVFEAIGLGQDLVDEYFTGTAQPPRRHRPRGARRRGGRPPRASPTPTGPRSGPTASSSSAASTSGAARASTTSSTRRRCSSCSTPPAPSRYDVFKEYTPLVDDQSEQPGHAARPVRAPRRRPPAGADRRGRAGRRDRRSASRPAP